MRAQGTTTGTLLARLLEESRAEIATEWRHLLLTRGLPYQQRLAREDPDALRAQFEQIIGLAITSLGALDPEVRREARRQLLDIYRGLGRRWAAAEGADPALAVDSPRITQAASQVLFTKYAASLQPDELLDSMIALNRLAMDLAMARVYGYMSFKEEVLMAQQRTVSRLIDELAQVETKERRALALTLHDSLAQHLVSLFSGIQHAERLVERDLSATRQELLRLKRIAQATIQEARNMIRDLHFGVTGHGGGFSALADYLSDLEADTGIRHEFHCAAPQPSLAPAHEALVIRIIQEAVINAHKHAACDRIQIAVEETETMLSVSVCDNGRGFNVEEALSRSRRRGRFGLLGMQERAQLLGASLTIESCPSKGTIVRLTVPKETPHERPDPDPHRGRP